MEITKSIYIQPTPDSIIPPTLNTTGSIALQGNGKMGYVPQHPNGNTIAGSEYTLGRSSYIGDNSHDNDGLILRKREPNSDDNIERNHKVLMCCEVSDPNILIMSRKNQHAHYLRFANCGPDEHMTSQNIMFEVANNGDIKSEQIDALVSTVADLFTTVNQLQTRVAALELGYL